MPNYSEIANFNGRFFLEEEYDTLIHVNTAFVVDDGDCYIYARCNTFSPRGHMNSDNYIRFGKVDKDQYFIQDYYREVTPEEASEIFDKRINEIKTNFGL